MSPRGLGITASPDALPEVVVALAALFTQLGDAWFLFVGLTLLYWLGDRRLAANPRRVGATLVAIGIGALAVSVGLKALFALPRPPGAGSATPPAWLPTALADPYVAAATGDGFGFPSGHAIAATMVYGGLARFLDAWDRSRRWLAAATVVAVVSLTRVALGVHYLVDVVVGVAAGALALALLAHLARPAFEPRPDGAFLAAGLFALLAVGVAFFHGHAGELIRASVALGAATGGYVVWRVRGVDDEPVGVAGALAGLAVTGVPFGCAVIVASGGVPLVPGAVPATTSFRLAVAVPAAFAVLALTLAWPTVLGRLHGRDAGGSTGDARDEAT